MEEKDFTYAHHDTSVPERESRTAQFNRPIADPAVREIRERAFAREIPVSSDETLRYLMTVAAAKRPASVLEIGTAVGVSGICLLNVCKHAQLTTIERNRDFFDEAKVNFEAAGVSRRVTQIYGDAGEILPKLDGAFDLIFLDGAKAQYVKYLPYLVNLLPAGGVLLADDVLLYGWVNGEQPVPKKRKMLVRHVREYLEAATGDDRLITVVVDVGDGIAMSVKK